MPGVPVISVIFAQAGIQTASAARSAKAAWIPAFAGMTKDSIQVNGKCRAWLPSARRLAGDGGAAMARTVPHPRALRETPGSHQSNTLMGSHASPAFYAVAGALLLAGCAATQSAAAVQPQAPGFLLGLWHGFIFPIAWVASLFFPDVSVYAVPNNGGGYDFGYFIGVVFFGAGSHGAARRR
jgi:hypothetical protein